MADLQNDQPEVTITTDGAARGNPRPGGWAALLQFGARERLLAGEGPEHTTNNAMEIYAVAAALETLKRPCRVRLRADSQYVIEGLKRLLAGGGSGFHGCGALITRMSGVPSCHSITFTAA